MKVMIENNIMKANEFVISAKGILPEIAVLKNVRLNYKMDAEGKKTDLIECVRYDCIDPDNFSTFSLKCESNRAVVTQEILESTEEPIFIRIPVEQTCIRPYEISYGKAKVTIVAPDVKLVEN